MVKTSVTDYVVGGIMATCVIAVFVLLYVYADINYDIEDIDTAGLTTYGDFNQMVSEVNQTNGEVYSISADSGLFDVLGGLVVKALTAIKSFFSSINFMISNTGKMLNFIHVPNVIILAIIAIVGILLAGVLLFKFISGKDDEK